MKTLTILGCGNSAGVPAIGNHWGKCDPNEPKNRRTRPSIVVRSETTTVQVDTGPDFREQANAAGIKAIDAILYTHAHSDHLLGIDEMRALNVRLGNAVTPIYGATSTLDEIQHRFDYLFTERHKLYPRSLDPNIIPPSAFGSTMKIGDIEFIPYLQDHGTCETLGFRFDSIAYSTDMMNLPPESFEVLKGIKTWIVDAAGYKMERNIVHATLENVYRFNDIVKAEQVFITHMPSGMDYQTLLTELPPGYAPAYDGLQLKF